LFFEKSGIIQRKPNNSIEIVGPGLKNYVRICPTRFYLEWGQTGFEYFPGWNIQRSFAREILNDQLEKIRSRTTESNNR